MKFKGIARGDSTYRHFIFDDQDVVKRGGITYYKVNYGKNHLEGDTTEDELGLVPIDKVMVIGGKKPNPPIEKPVEKKSEPTPVKEQVQEVPKPKRGRPKKEVPVEQVSTSVRDFSDKFEYYVNEFHMDDVHELQRKLNELGDDGWELCGFDSYKGLFSGVLIVGVFKRKRG